MSNSIDRSSGGGSTSTSTGASPGGLSSAIVDGTSPGGSSGGVAAAAAAAVGQVSPDPQQQQQSSTPAVDPSWSRRGLERLSGLKEFGFEVLSRRQRHERDKSGGTSSSRSQQQEPRSPEAHKASPPYSRSTTADGDPRSPDSGSTATASTPASAVPTSTIAAVNPAPDLPARPPPQASHSSSNSASNMNYSSNSRSPGPLSAGSTSSMKKPTFVLVTQDHESLAKVDIANLGSPAAIRERLYTKAHIPDDDFQHCTLHLSSLDQVDPGTSLDDGEIWQICQGVVSGELVPAPLFYVRMSVDQGAGNASNNGGSSSSRSSNQYSSASPEYQYTPSSPFLPHGQSPFGDHAAAPVAGPSNPRPDSRHDTSSNSSVSATRRPPSRSHYSRSNTQDLSLASPLRTEQQQQAQHQQLPSSSSSHRPHSANHSPQPPHSSFFEPDRRASAEQGLVRDRAHHHTSRSHDYADQQQQQQQQQQYHQAWERRSSAGTSDYSDRPEWLERPSQLRRQERQSHSESSHPRPQWDPRDMPPPPPRQPVTVQQVGVGPSGPIYRSMAAAPSSSSSRPRANSASNGDPNFDQPYPSHQGRPCSSSGRSQPPPFNGTPHFPQPHPYHHDPVASSSSRRQQNLSELPPHLQPGSSRNDHNLNSVRSMGDLRGNPSNYGRMGPSPPGGMPPPSSSSGMPQTSRSPYAPPPTLYEDPRYGSQPMRVGASDMGRPSSQVVSPRNTFQHSLSPPPSHPQARMPPTNTSPRIPSYPPAVQRLPPPLHPSQMPRPGSAQQRGYPAPPVAHRRPSYEQMQRPMVVPPQLLAGPQRIPLQPGETVQESLQGQQYSQRQARHSGGSTHTSPRHSQTTFEPLPPSHPSHQHQHHHHHQHQQQQQSQPQPLHHHSQQLPSSYAGRAHSYEERARPFSAQEAHFRGQPQPNNNASRPQFVQQDSFTSSPPLQSNENYLYEQQAFDYATPRHNTDNGRRTPGVSYTSPQFFEVHRSTGDVNSEHPQSPASSRLSTSSDAQSLDKSAHRPESYSSNSTNEVPTPASDRVEKPRRLPYEPHGIKPPQLASLDIVPHVVDQDDVYEGVEILRESIDAATIDDEEKGQSQYDSRPTTADASARPEAGEEATSTIQASEWANLISRINEKGEGSDGDTLGKSSKRQSIEKSDEESSTLGKSKPSPLALDKRVAETADKKPAKVEEAKAASPFVMPTPAITYNPDDDDDDEVMTWAVQMKPTKKPEETPAKITEEVTSPQKQKTSASSSTSAHVGRTEPPKHISIPSSALIENASVSPRVERPALKLQTDMLGPNGTPPQKHSPLPHAVSTSHSSKSHKSNHASVSALVSSEKQPSSASPRSAARRHRQSSKDSLSAEETNAASSTSTHHSHHSHGQRKTSDNSRIDAPSNDADRRPSFDNNDWAFRPPVEQVYENLEDFFPGHDLDKPIVDVGASGSNSAVSSPAQESAPFISPTRVKAAVDEERPSPSTVTQPHAHAATSTETEPLLSRKEKDSSAREADSARRFNHNRKSMRMVAHDRKIRMKREETLNKAAAIPSSSKDANALKLARRKSTKVWGRKIEEVTAAEADLLHSARTDASERDELAPIKWVKGELIGKGTYGHVYIGFNVTNGEMIAVKQVELPRTASDKEDNRQLSVIEALKSEMELLKDLEHEKIVSYLGFEETPSHLSILLEYVPGGSVGRCLRKYGKFDVQVIQFFTTQILEGLEYLHARGILHRDLKADNILVKMDGTIKISDFGISKRSNDIYNNNSNMSMQGSIFWMAPEVVHNQRKGYSAKIDIWSLGCVVLEMFAGRRPWDSEEAIQAMFKLGAERLAPPVPKDVVLTNQSSHFLKECFHGEADRRPTASRLLCHKFLTLDKNWDFRTCSLAKAMSATS